MNTTEQIISKCGGVGKLSTDLDLSLYTVCDWIAANNIPAKHWRVLVETYKVDIDDLLSLEKGV